jgi:hypothetical protein
LRISSSVGQHPAFHLLLCTEALVEDHLLFVAGSEELDPVVRVGVACLQGLDLLHACGSVLQRQAWVHRQGSASLPDRGSILWRAVYHPAGGVPIQTFFFSTACGTYLPIAGPTHNLFSTSVLKGSLGALWRPLIDSWFCMEQGLRSGGREGKPDVPPAFSLNSMPWTLSCGRPTDRRECVRELHHLLLLPVTACFHSYSRHF